MTGNDTLEFFSMKMLIALLRFKAHLGPHRSIFLSKCRAV